MPTLTLTVTYDGSDAQVIQMLNRMVSSVAQSDNLDNVGMRFCQKCKLQADTMHCSRCGSPTIASRDIMRFPRETNGVFKKTATKFAGFVSRTPRLKAVMEVWLRKNGRCPLTELVKVSGVAKQHDYAGIGSALTRNMKKAGGPKDWYDAHQEPSGEWIYEIADELVQPLKQAFGI